MSFESQRLNNVNMHADRGNVWMIVDVYCLESHSKSETNVVKGKGRYIERGKKNEEGQEIQIRMW